MAKGSKHTMPHALTTLAVIAKLLPATMAFTTTGIAQDDGVLSVGEVHKDHVEEERQQMWKCRNLGDLL